MVNDSQLTGGVREGDVLAGKYRIDKVLGVGGMGVVVAAHHLDLDEHVAIKFLLPEVLGNAEVIGRFAREARAAVKIKSEHVARVIDVGALENGSPYMVMEYLEGLDLSAWLEQRGVLSVEQAVEFILQASEAIAEAHGLGIVHRDLKPANLFCIQRPDGVLSVKVLDFGISKTANSSMSGADMGMTKTASVMGSPLYMSPEQLKSSRDVDLRADIWSLGIILYELLTAHVPFTGDSLPALCLAIVGGATPSIRASLPEFPIGLEQTINRCLEKNREKRFGNVAELAIALAPFGPKRSRASVERIQGVTQRAGLATSVLSLPASLQPGPGAQEATAVSWGQTAGPKQAEKRTWLIVGIVSAVCIAVVVAAMTFARWGTKPTTRTAALVPTSLALPTPAAPSPVSTLAVKNEPNLAASASPAAPSAVESPTPTPRASNVDTVVSVAPVSGKARADIAKPSDKSVPFTTASSKRSAGGPSIEPKEPTVVPPAKPAPHTAAKSGLYDDMQ